MAIVTKVSVSEMGATINNAYDLLLAGGKKNNKLAGNYLTDFMHSSLTAPSVAKVLDAQAYKDAKNAIYLKNALPQGDVVEGMLENTYVGSFDNLFGLAKLALKRFNVLDSDVNRAFRRGVKNSFKYMYPETGHNRNKVVKILKQDDEIIDLIKAERDSARKVRREKLKSAK